MTGRALWAGQCTAGMMGVSAHSHAQRGDAAQLWNHEVMADSPAPPLPSHLAVPCDHVSAAQHTAQTRASDPAHDVSLGTLF